jgi:exonuclease III
MRCLCVESKHDDMKILTWNCNGALRNKTAAIDRLGADVLIIQECKNPAESTKDYQTWAGADYLWVGESRHKGLGVFPKNGHTVRGLNWQGNFRIPGVPSKSPALNWSTNDLKLFMPFVVNGEISILGVWTKADKSNEIFGYVGQLWKYLQIHRRDLSSGKTLVVGDFNSNAIWDKPERWWNHSDVTKELKDIDLESIYHIQFNEAYGKESKPTFFLHRHKNRPYHIDYAFASSDLQSKCKLEIGSYDEWISFSDHMPLCLAIK